MRHPPQTKRPAALPRRPDDVSAVTDVSRGHFPARVKGRRRIFRNADDFVTLVHSARDDVHTLREDIAAVLEPPGTTAVTANTQILHMSESLNFRRPI